MTADALSASERIRAMTADELSAYLRRRLRLEEPLDPPLDHRFGREPPEEAVICAWRQGVGDGGFAGRLLQAIQDNLRQLAAERDGLRNDPAMREQLASLAFLTGKIGAKALVLELTDAARDLWARLRADPGAAAVLNDPLFPVTNALSDLDDSAELAPLWRDILAASHDRGLRTVAWFGLWRSDPDGLSARLPDLVEDRAITLSNVAGAMAHGYQAAARLGKAARDRLTSEQAARLRAALEAAGTEPAALREFDDPPFDFTEVSPELRPVRRVPRWAHESMQEAA